MRSLSVAVPDSALSDESLKIDKTRKASVLARACAIFGVQTIYIYRDETSQKSGNQHTNKKKRRDRQQQYQRSMQQRASATDDGHLLMYLLRYLETPQFLRKRLFPKINELKFAGVLHPLRIPSHTVLSDPKKIMRGDAREGLVVSVKGARFVDVGIKDQLVPFFGRTETGKRVTVRFKEGYPNFSVKEIGRDEVPNYWGYTVKERASLFSLMTEWTKRQDRGERDGVQGDIIITSKKGRNMTWPILTEYTRSDRPVLVVFGSPERGIHEMLGERIRNIQNARSINFFPGQVTQTVRLEEALLGTLTIINACKQEVQHDA